jgi:hypothetical protein
MDHHVKWRTNLNRMRAESFRDWGCFDGDMFLYGNEPDHPLYDQAKEFITIRDISPWYDPQFLQKNTPTPKAIGKVGNMMMTKLTVTKHFAETYPEYDVIMMTDIDVLAVRDVNPLFQEVTPEKPIFLGVGPMGMPMGDWRGANGFLNKHEALHTRKIGAPELCSSVMMGTPSAMAEMASFTIDTVCTRKYRVNQGLKDHYEQAAVNYWAYKNHGKFGYFGKHLLQGTGISWIRPMPDVCLVHFFSRHKDKIVPFVNSWREMR